MLTQGTFQFDIGLYMAVFGLIWSGWWMPRRIIRFKDEEEL
jgi:hypothetical protein